MTHVGAVRTGIFVGEPEVGRAQPFIRPRARETALGAALLCGCPPALPFGFPLRYDLPHGSDLRSSDGRIGEGLEGVGFLARKSNVPVIPAFIKGTQRAMPKGAKFIKPARLTVVFGPAVRFSEEDCVSDKARTAEIMRQVALLKEFC